MEFGAWLRSVRESRGLDLRAFGKLTNVDPSTISRIENQRTEVTLGTAIRICDSLNLEIPDLLEALVEKDRLREIQNLPIRTDASEVLTYRDLMRFLYYIYSRPRVGPTLLSSILSDAVEAESSNDLSDEYFPPVPANNMRWFFDNPVVFVQAVVYPPRFTSEHILQTYLQGGVMTFADVGAYIRGVRKANRTTLASLEELTERSASVLSRIEAGSLARVKLRDVLTLDQQLGTGNEILGMFWRAAQLRAAVAGPIPFGDETHNGDLIAEFIVTAFRWLQLHPSLAERWLQSFRNLHESPAWWTPSTPNLRG